MKQIILIALLLGFFASCNKDDDPQIIEPGPYFPVYPNSWWKYLINDSIEIVDSTGKSYVLSQYVVDDKYNDEHYSGIDYLPWYYSADGSPIGYSGPVFRYDRLITGDNWFGTLLWPILSEEIGYSFDWAPRDQYPDLIDKMTVEEKKVEGNDSVLIVTGRPYINDEYVPGQGIRYMKFVKGIGLAMDYRYDSVLNDTMYKKVLIDYYVSKWSY